MIISLIFNFIFGFAFANVDQLQKCESAARPAFNFRHHLIKKDNHLVIRELAQSQPALKDRLLLYTDAGSYALNLPEYSNHYSKEPKKHIVQLPSGEFCMHYEINWLWMDRLLVFEKMPSKSCSGQELKIKAVSDPALSQKLASELQKNLESLNKTIDSWMEKGVTSSNRPQLEKISQINFSDCLKLLDGKISQQIFLLKPKIAQLLGGSSPNPAGVGATK